MNIAAYAEHVEKACRSLKSHGRWTVQSQELLSTRQFHGRLGFFPISERHVQADSPIMLMWGNAFAAWPYGERPTRNQETKKAFEVFNQKLLSAMSQLWDSLGRLFPTFPLCVAAPFAQV